MPVTDVLGAGEGYFPTIGTTNLDIETALLAMSAERAGILDSVVRDRMTMMQKQNENIRKLQEALQEFNLVSAKLDEKGKVIGPFTKEVVEFVKELDPNKELFEILETEEIEVGEDGEEKKFELKLKKKGSLKKLTENLSTEIDKQSSNSQLDMIKLQGTINKYNQAIDMMTNVIQKFANTKDKIISNIR